MIDAIEVGDEVEGYLWSDKPRTGKLIRATLIGTPDQDGDVRAIRNSGSSVCLNGSSLRLIRKRAESSAPSEGEFYGTMPAELPKTLPAGSRFSNGGGRLFELDEECRLAPSGTYICARYQRLTPDPAKGLCHDGNGGARPEWFDWTTVRVSPAPSDETKAAEKWEPKVGEEIEGESYVGRHVRRGRFAEFTQGTDGHFARLYDGHYLHRETIRPAASPSQKPDPFAVNCGDCGRPIENPLEACARTRRGMSGEIERLPGTFHSKCPVAARPDPYRTPATETTGYALWAAEQDGRHAAKVEAHRKELDRTTAERLRNTRHWPEAWSRPGWES